MVNNGLQLSTHVEFAVIFIVSLMAIATYVEIKERVKFLDLDLLKEHLLLEHSLFTNKLVAHRGFHYNTDNTRRPLENSVRACEQAWVAQVRYCECDVRLTKDGVLVLSHDPDMQRLANDNSKIEESTFAQLSAITLIDGSTISSLAEVLAVASRFGDYAMLLIELKGKNTQVASALATFLEKESETIGKHIRVVMSFSLNLMDAFAQNIDRQKHKTISLMLLTVSASRLNKDEGTVALDFYSHQNTRTIVKNHSLDGIYVEFENSFFLGYDLAYLSRDMLVGVWFEANPSDLTTTTDQRASTIRKLVDKGVHFINTDFPDNFF